MDGKSSVMMQKVIAFLEKNFRIKRWERHELAGKAQAPLFRKGFLRELL